jgi:hypothetical protein
MIDQLVSGMPQPIPAKPASNDRQSAGSDSQDGGTETFGSLVSRAEQQQKKGDRDSRYDATDGREERPATGIAEAGARSPFELSVAVLVRGPSRLYDMLKPKLDERGIACRHVEAETIDVLVEINETVLTTRLSVWAQSLAEVME